ncbi:MAG: ABC transporter ATP-binding protein [Acidimicrobiales bacterium]
MAYGPVRVIDGIDLEVGDAELVALLGTNGAGKSTVLKAVSGLLPLLGGTISLDGEDLTGAAPENVLRAGIGHVPGGRGLLADLTVDENLRLGGHLLTSSQLRPAIAEATESFPWMAKRHNQLAGTLSGGEQQMLAIARALVSAPRVLMIDELSLGLAPVIVEDLMALVRRLRTERGIAVVLVEQHVTLALAVADRAYFLERGKVRFSGPAGELLERDDLLRSVFLEGAPVERREAALRNLAASERLQK